jgi:steroid delta-isomerase-like uncharacterized protein
MSDREGMMISQTSKLKLSDYPAKYFNAWNQRDIEVALAVVSNGIVWTDPSLPATLTSRAEARGFFEGSWASFPDLEFEALGNPLVDESSRRVAQEWRMRGTDNGSGFGAGGRPTGRSFDVTGLDVWIVDEDLMAVSVAAYYDTGSLARQLGMI